MPTKNFTDTGVRANEVLGAPWKVSGDWRVVANKLVTATAPGSAPVAVVDPGVRSTGYADVDASVKAAHNDGTALYVRYRGVNDWIRLRFAHLSEQVSSQYYVTEYQHTTYEAQEEWAAVTRTYTFQRYYQEWQYYNTKTQYEIQNYTFSSWAATGNFVCQTNAPSGSSSKGQQYRWVAASTMCNGFQRWREEERHWVTGSVSWSDSQSVNDQQELTGNTRTVAATTTYWTSSYTGTNFYTGNSRLTAGGTYSNTTGVRQGADDVETGQSDSVTGYYWKKSGSTGSSSRDYKTGATRNAAVGTYWDSSYEAGVPTRQAGPYTSTSTQHTYSAVLEKAVGGNVTALGATKVLGSTRGTTLRLVARRDSIKAYVDATLTHDVTVADAALAVGDVGIGAVAVGALSQTYPFQGSDFSVKPLEVEAVRTDAGTVVLPRSSTVRLAGGVSFETDSRARKRGVA